MKQILLGVIISCLFFLSCSNSNQNSNPKELIGKWSINSDNTLELKDSGVAIETSPFGTFKRTWSVEGNKFCLVPEEGITSCGDFTLKDDVFSWYPNVLGKEMKFIYKREGKGLSNNHNLLGKWSLKYNNGVSIDGASTLEFKPDGTVYEIIYGTDVDSKEEGEKHAGIWTYCDGYLYTAFLTGSGVNCNEFHSMEGKFHNGSNEFTWYTIIEGGEKITLIYERK